jgi:hypothetical protein
MYEEGGDGGYERGAFACVGSDDRIHSVLAWVTGNGRLVLTTDGGQVVKHVVKGRYVGMIDGRQVRLRCDHPDAP